MKEAVLSLREIGRRLNRNVITVARAWRAWSEEHQKTPRRGRGRLRVSQPREHRLLRRLAIRNPFEPSQAVGINWLRAIERPISRSTIYRRIASLGLHSYRPYFRFPLTAE